MAVSVEVNGKRVEINAVFKDAYGVVTNPPAGATYEWSVIEGGDIAVVVFKGPGNSICTVTPIDVGQLTIGLAVKGESLETPLIGELVINVISMQPVSVELNGSVFNNA